MKKDWNKYESQHFFDELITNAGNPRQVARRIVNLLGALSKEEMADRRAAAELTIRDMGISFTVYDEGSNIDRDWPFDIIPRTISSKDWAVVKKSKAKKKKK